MKKLLIFLVLLSSLTVKGQYYAGGAATYNKISDITNVGSAGSCVVVLGSSVPGDGGGGIFYWNATSTATPVAGQIIQIATVTTGRWLRISTLNSDSTAIRAISITTTGDSVGAATYNSTTGVLHIPRYLSGLGAITQYIRGNGTMATLALDARRALSLIAPNSSGSATYDTLTGIFNVPAYTAVDSITILGNGNLTPLFIKIDSSQRFTSDVEMFGKLNKDSNLTDLNDIDLARVNLGIDKRTIVADVNYTIVPSDKTVSLTSISASRTLTLPAANSVNAGYSIIIVDESGSITSSHTLSIARAGSDLINGASTSIVIASAYGGRVLVSDGVSNWTQDASIARLTTTQTLTNKTIDITTNTLNLAAYSIPANNTSGAAGAANLTYEDLGIQSYTGTPTWDGTPPATIANAQFQWRQIGKVVEMWLWMDYTTAGTTNTTVDFPVPTGLPNPIEPTGRTSTNSIVATGIARVATNAAPTPNTLKPLYFIRTGTLAYKFTASLPSGNYKSADLYISYLTP